MIICRWRKIHSQFPCRAGCRPIESMSESSSSAENIVFTKCHKLERKPDPSGNPPLIPFCAEFPEEKSSVLMSRVHVGHDAAYTSPLPGTTRSPEVRHVACTDKVRRVSTCEQLSFFKNRRHANCTATEWRKSSFQFPLKIGCVVALPINRINIP